MVADRLLTSLQSTKPVAGLTHNFYRYPARMSPELAHAVIELFSEERDMLFDPFMGGGTGVVEAVAAGRRAIGIDVNPLATFVTTVKTTPLSTFDKAKIREWADRNDFSRNYLVPEAVSENEFRTKNLPAAIEQLFANSLSNVDILPFARQRHFVRCVLLRLGQWAVDCKTAVPESDKLKEKLYLFIEDMLNDLDLYVASARNHGLAKNKLTQQRMILLRSVIDAQHDARLSEALKKPKLVLTSPPYPGVHVLYHRWQVQGRRETPAPYWLINAQDGNGAAYYTLGGRSKLGLRNYFQSITEAYRSVRAIIHPGALIVQLVAFSDTEAQLPAFLEAMKQAGYREENPTPAGHSDLWRQVPHRKWYNYISVARSTGQELLLFHRPDSEG